jgi:hypothetical protein
MLRGSGACALAFGGPLNRAAGVLAFGSGFKVGAVAARAAGRGGRLTPLARPPRWRLGGLRARVRGPLNRAAGALAFGAGFRAVEARAAGPGFR